MGASLVVALGVLGCGRSALDVPDGMAGVDATREGSGGTAARDGGSGGTGRAEAGTGGAGGTGGVTGNTGGIGGAAGGSGGAPLPDASFLPDRPSPTDGPLEVPDTRDVAAEGALDAAADSGLDRPADVSAETVRDSGSEIRVDARDLGEAREASVDRPDLDAGAPALALLAGTPGGQGDIDGVGAAARFGAAAGMWSDGTGTVWIADTDNHIVRKMAVATGKVTTVAGTAGKPGVADGTGADARFREPAAIAADGSGNLFIADRGNHTIRKLVLATGAVTTLAGGPAEEGYADGVGQDARFYGPSGIVWDGAGNLLVADTYNQIIRRVVVATGGVTTVAGQPQIWGGADGSSTTAQFHWPTGIAMDSADNLYIADRGNNSIRRLALATGEVTTLAGASSTSGWVDGIGAEARFDQPAGIAFDGAGALFVADAGNEVIRSLVIATAEVATVDGLADSDGEGQMFISPVNVASDGAGHLLVTDLGFRVRAIDLQSRVLSTLAGAAFKVGSTDGSPSEARFLKLAGVASDENGDVFVVDSEANTIRRFDHATNRVTTLAGSAQEAGSGDGVGAQARFKVPWGIASDGAGHLFVSDSGNHTIRRIDTATAEVTTIAGSAGTLGRTNGVGIHASFACPSGLTLDDDGNLYIADRCNHMIRRLTLATGQAASVAGSGAMGYPDGTRTAARFNTPYGVTYDGQGNLYVADTKNNRIRKIAIDGGVVTTLAGPTSDWEDSAGAVDGVASSARFFEPYDVVADRAGVLYVADHGNHTIRRIFTDTASVTTWIGSSHKRGLRLGKLPAGLSSPIGVAIEPSGTLLITDDGENVLLTMR